jgi:hypothetical protein
MDGATLKELAKEREARRQESSGSAAGPAGPAVRPSRPASFATLGSAPTSNRASAASKGVPLKSAHRSVRLARSLGLGVALLSLLVPGLIFRSATWTALPLLAGLGLARSGGAWLHGMLPAMYLEGAPPAPPAVAAGGALASPRAMLDTRAWAEEWDVALENLAFVCTYGKKNCLTSQMYTGPLSLGKICSLVAGKLSEGVVRC